MMDSGAVSSSSSSSSKVRRSYNPLAFYMDSAVEYPAPILKGNKYSESNMDKSVNKNSTPLSFYNTTLVYHPHLSKMDIFLQPNQEELRKYYHHHPLGFYFFMNPTVSIPGIRINYIPLSSSMPSTAIAAVSKSKVSFPCFGCQSSESKYESKVISRNCIPDDVGFFILSKLSIKSLKRFGCVCKSWSILFESTYFMTMYSKHFISCHGSHDDYHTFIIANHHGDDDVDGLYHSEFHLLENRLKLNLPSPLQPYSEGICILGSTSVNGILCLRRQPSTQESKYVLWNPLTEEFKAVPPSPAELTPTWVEGKMFEDEIAEHSFHGFGYDQLRDDFKVIQYVTFHSYSRLISLFEIYSLKSNSWRMIHMDQDLWLGHHKFYSEPFNGLEVYVDGACHWLISRSINRHQNALSLLSFDLSEEVFLTTPIGEETFSSPYYLHHKLTVLNESIALISNYNDVFHISIMGELGVSESWIKLYIYDPLPSIQWPPIGFGKMGYMFITKKDYEVANVDLSTQIIEEVDIIADGYRNYADSISFTGLAGLRPSNRLYLTRPCPVMLGYEAYYASIAFELLVTLARDPLEAYHRLEQ
ncbi:hypothetical protein TSUD_396800 [Trifolium subterraneum]|uniref:Uncharacterized protein n=1 Tax=Trifolium subterraneum TaxID=3900 RepID=A0A2Z6NAW5_TRISU|nr:hypothetical protein TSUD_396800 [Trifolium subterraneum]